MPFSRSRPRKRERRVLAVESLACRDLMAADVALTPTTEGEFASNIAADSATAEPASAFVANTADVNRFDLNGDGRVTDLDAHVLTFELREHGIQPTRDSDTRSLQLDLNGDQLISAADLLLLANHLNSRHATTAEGPEGEPDPPRGACDSNGDGSVTDEDALLLMSMLNQSGSAEMPAPKGLDLNGDNLLSPIDILIIVNYLNPRRDDSKIPLIAEEDETTHEPTDPQGSDLDRLLCSVRNEPLLVPCLGNYNHPC